MKLKTIGEFGFIESFKDSFKNMVPADGKGIGDDCAIVAANACEDYLVTTDLLVENVHFLRNDISARDLGLKSVAVNLSDIAAMGGTPIGSFLSIAIPKDTEVEYLNELMQGYHDISARYATPLLGGDTTSSEHDLVINVCVLGRCPKGKALLRSSARVGDLICTTGLLGDSGGGLQAVLHDWPRDADVRYLIERHYGPEPRLAMGEFLLRANGVHAMMDISDGISSDINHILKASGVGAVIDVARVPMSEVLKRTASAYGFSAIEQAISGGEDYELLFTVAADAFESLNADFMRAFSSPLYCIGHIECSEPVVEWQQNGEPYHIGQVGYNHFQS